MSEKQTYRFRCTKTKCSVEYEVSLLVLEAIPCPKCHDTEFVEAREVKTTLKQDMDKYDTRRIDDYGYNY